MSNKNVTLHLKNEEDLIQALTTHGGVNKKFATGLIDHLAKRKSFLEISEKVEAPTPTVLSAKVYKMFKTLVRNTVCFADIADRAEAKQNAIEAEYQERVARSHQEGYRGRPVGTANRSAEEIGVDKAKKMASVMAREKLGISIRGAIPFEQHEAYANTIKVTLKTALKELGLSQTLAETLNNSKVEAKGKDKPKKETKKPSKTAKKGSSKPKAAVEADEVPFDEETSLIEQNEEVAVTV